ncbi:MAG: hypothetical protein RIT17_1638, partial [Pseudomonadota bacterium]
MRKMFALAGMAALAIGTSAIAGSDDTRTVSGTVDQSEWGEPGELSINLATGEYSFKPGVWTTPRDGGKRRGAPLNGNLAPAALGELNAIVAEAETAGLVNMQCASIDRSERAQFIVSNGGKQEVVVKSSGRSLTSHPDLECWTQPANDLHAALQRVIDA